MFPKASDIARQPANVIDPALVLGPGTGIAADEIIIDARQDAARLGVDLGAPAS
jgi:hypothetical protein